MEYKVSRMIANKKKYIFHIIMAVFVLVAITISIVGSFATYQYSTAKKNFVDNKFAKTIEVSSYSLKSNETRKLAESDIRKIETILSGHNKTKIIAEHLINFGIQTSKGDVIFIKSFSNDFFVENKQDINTLITKKDYGEKKLELNIPVIKVESGGYTSNKLIENDYKISMLDKASILNNYFKEDEIIAPESLFKEITKTMFPDRQFVDVEKIYVNVESIDEIREVASLLSSNKYNINHAFSYYDDLDVSVGKLVNLSLILFGLLLVFAICLLTGLFELMLKNSVGDIAVLKHLGYRENSIKRIYLYPMILRLLGSLIIISLSNFILYKLDVISNVFVVGIFGAFSLALGSLALMIMSGRISFYSRQPVLKLLNSYKVEE